MNKTCANVFEVETAIRQLHDLAHELYGRKGEVAVETIAWYINTGRASCQFGTALAQCKDREDLLRKILPVWASTEGVVKKTKTFLRIR